MRLEKEVDRLWKGFEVSEDDQKALKEKVEATGKLKQAGLTLLKETAGPLWELESGKLMEELDVTVEDLEPKPTDAESKNKAVKDLKKKREEEIAKLHQEMSIMWEIFGVGEEDKKAFKETLEATGELKTPGFAMLKGKRDELRGQKREKLTDADIKLAVKLWFENRESAEAIYGPMSDWNVAEVSDMSELFQDRRTFNEDISKWDVRSVITMRAMFANAKSFNIDISGWNVSSLTNMRSLFYKAKKFDQDLSKWDVANVTVMRSVFCGAESFNSSISTWDTAKATTMEIMFKNAKSFAQDISSWDVGKVENMDRMLDGANAFDKECIKGWAKKP